MWRNTSTQWKIPNRKWINRIKRKTWFNTAATNVYTHKTKQNKTQKKKRRRRKRSQTKTSSQHSAQCNNNGFIFGISHYSLYRMFMTILSCVGRVATHYSLFIAFQFGAFTAALQSFQLNQLNILLFNLSKRKKEEKTSSIVLSSSVAVYLGLQNNNFIQIWMHSFHLLFVWRKRCLIFCTYLIESLYYACHQCFNCCL